MLLSEGPVSVSYGLLFMVCARYAPWSFPPVTSRLLLLPLIISPKHILANPAVSLSAFVAIREKTRP